MANGYVYRRPWNRKNLRDLHVGGASSKVSVSGQLAAQVATVSASSKVKINASGQLAAQIASASASSKVKININAALVAQSAAASAVAKVKINSSGQLVAQSALAAAASKIKLNANGVLIDQSASLAGTAKNRVSANGILLAQVAALSGSGKVKINVNGHPAAQSATLAAFTSVGLLAHVNGALVAQSSLLTVTVKNRISTNGTLLAQAAAISGTGRAKTNVNGSLSAQAATVAATSTIGLTRVNGAIASQVANLAAAVRDKINVTSLIVAQPSSLSATVRNKLTINGTIASQAAHLAAAVRDKINVTGTPSAQSSSLSATVRDKINVNGAAASLAASLAASVSIQKLNVSASLAAQSAHLASTARDKISVGGILSASSSTIQGTTTAISTQTIVYVNGFETGDTRQLASIYDAGFGAPSVQSVTKHSGGWGLKLPALSQATCCTGLNSTKTAFSFQLKAPTSFLPAFYFVESSASTDRLLFYTDGTTGTIQDVSSTLGLPNVDFVLSPDVFQLIEFSIDLAANGAFRVWVDGVLVVDTIHTTDATGAPTDSCRLQSVTPLADCYVDDIVVATGSTEPLGRKWIIARQGIAGTPTYNSWTKTGAATAALCWSATPFATGANCNSSTSAAAQTMLINPFSSAGSATEGSEVLTVTHIIDACQTLFVAKRAASGSAKIRRRVGGADFDTTKTLTTSDVLYNDGFWTTTFANLNLLEAGAVKAADTSLVTVEDVWVMVCYSLPRGHLYAQAASVHGSVRDFINVRGTMVAAASLMLTGVNGGIPRKRRSVFSIYY